MTITYSDFVCENVSTTIPINLEAHYVSTGGYPIASGDALVFKGRATGSLTEPYGPGNFPLEALYVETESGDWGKALAGEYTATITFTAEVVAG